MSEYDTSDSEVEGSFDPEKYNVNKNGCILLIDTSSEMFDERGLFKMLLEACYNILDKYFIKTYTKNFTVCYMHEENPVIKPPEEDIVVSLKKFKEYLEMSEEDLRKRFETSNSVSLSRILNVCKMQFYNMKKINPHLVVVTTNSNPCSGLKDASKEMSNLMDAAASLKDKNIKFYVLPLVSNFSYDHVYGELLSTVNNMPRDEIESSEIYESSDEIVDVLIQLTNSRRNVRRTLFHFSDDSYIYIQVKKFTAKNTKLRFAYFDRETNEEIVYARREKRIRNTLLLGLHSLPLKLPPQIIDKYRNLKDCNIGLTLLYVADKQSDIHRAVKGAFIVQIDELVPVKKDAQRLFSYMWDYCDKKKKALVCLYIVLSGRNCPRIVELTAETHQGKPAFWASYLPHREYTKLHLPCAHYEKEPRESKPPEYLVESCVDAMSKLVVDKDSVYHIPNNTYVRRVNLIKNQTLDLELPLPMSNRVPKEQIHKRMARYGDKFKDEMIEKYGFVHNTKPRKRPCKEPARSTEGSSAIKRRPLSSVIKQKPSKAEPKGPGTSRIY